MYGNSKQGVVEKDIQAEGNIKEQACVLKRAGRDKIMNKVNLEEERHTSSISSIEAIRAEPSYLFFHSLQICGRAQSSTEMEGERVGLGCCRKWERSKDKMAEIMM